MSKNYCKMALLMALRQYTYDNSVGRESKVKTSYSANHTLHIRSKKIGTW